MTVTVGWVHHGTVDERFAVSLFDLAMAYPRLVGGRVSVSSPNITRARCQVAERFLAGSSEWLWFLDTDVAFSSDALVRLLEAAERPGIYAAAYWDAEGRLTWKSLENGALAGVEELGAECREIAACGMGCTLIHRDVLAAVGASHQGDPWCWFGNDILDTPEGKVRLGEDVSFCLRAAREGFGVVGVPVRVEHRKLVSV
jgi:GT2 family glycosyltransferase